MCFCVQVYQWPFFTIFCNMFEFACNSHYFNTRYAANDNLITPKVHTEIYKHLSIYFSPRYYYYYYYTYCYPLVDLVRLFERDHREEWCKVISCRDSVQPCSYKSPCRGVITSTQLWPVIQAWRARWVVKNLFFSIIVYSGSLATKPVDLEELVTTLLHFWEDWCIMRVCGSPVQAWAWNKLCWVIYIYKPLGPVIQARRPSQSGALLN